MRICLKDGAPGNLWGSGNVKTPTGISATSGAK